MLEAKGIRLPDPSLGAKQRREDQDRQGGRRVGRIEVPIRELPAGDRLSDALVEAEVRMLDVPVPAEDGPRQGETEDGQAAGPEEESARERLVPVDGDVEGAARAGRGQVDRAVPRRGVGRARLCLSRSVARAPRNGERDCAAITLIP